MKAQSRMFKISFRYFKPKMFVRKRKIPDVVGQRKYNHEQKSVKRKKSAIRSNKKSGKNYGSQSKRRDSTVNAAVNAALVLS